MNKIGQISLICAVLVVLIHVPPGGLDVEQFKWFFTVVPHGYCTVAVPFFFAFSGYFLGRRTGSSGWWKSCVIKRIRTILIPYVIWCLLMFCCVSLMVIVANSMAGRYLSANLWPKGFLFAIWQGLGLNLLNVPLLIPFWYMRALMLFVASSFVLNSFLRVKPTVKIAMIYIMGICLDCISYEGSMYRELILHGVPFCGLAMFSFGFALGAGYIKNPSVQWPFVKTYVLGVACLMLSGMLMFFKLTMLRDEIFSRVLDHIFKLTAMIGIWFVWSEKKIAMLKDWEWLSFAIFAIHPFVIFVIDQFEFYTKPETPFTYFFYGGAVVAVSVFSGILLSACLPSFANVMFGGRTWRKSVAVDDLKD